MFTCINNVDTTSQNMILLFLIEVCSILQDSANGQVIVHEDTAFLSVFTGTVVVGNPILTCINGKWNNPPPICKLLN